LAYTPGFKAGLLGMADGEQRTIVVEPSQGFGDVSDTNANTAFRDDTLVYDILVSEINPG
jgi:FKBP-type peptidyl-prolyl cis-trans isomerase 2